MKIFELHLFTFLIKNKTTGSVFTLFYEIFHLKFYKTLGIVNLHLPTSNKCNFIKIIPL